MPAGPSLRRLLFLLGPPGSGKTTQGALLAARLQGLHVSAGELVRAARADGERVPRDPGPAGRDGLADVDWMARRVAAACAGDDPVVIDGFPRIGAHLDAAQALGRALGAVRISISLDAAIDRMRGRGRDGEDLARIAYRWHIHRRREAELEEAMQARGLLVLGVDGEGATEEVAARVQAAVAMLLRQL